MEPRTVYGDVGNKEVSVEVIMREHRLTVLLAVVYSILSSKAVSI